MIKSWVGASLLLAFFTACSSPLFAEDVVKPIKVFRYRNLATRAHAFTTDDESQRRLPALYSQEGFPGELASSPLFYVSTEQHGSTVSVYRFRAADGSMRFAANEEERNAFRNRGLQQVDAPVYVYKRQVEGASEIYRLANPQDDDVIYTTSSEERDYYLGRSWTEQPSLGFTQATSSSGTGILRGTTVKLEQDDLSLVLQPVRSGGRPVFSAKNLKFADLTPGTVLYSEKTVQLPLGLVAKVKSVSRGRGGALEIETSPATLADAFEEYHIYIDNRPVSFLPSESDAGQGAVPRAKARLILPESANSDAVGGLLRPEYLSGVLRPDNTASSGTYSTTLAYNGPLGKGSPIALNVQLNYSLTGEVLMNNSLLQYTGQVLFTPSLTGTAAVTLAAQFGSSADDVVLLPALEGTFPVGGIPITVSLDLLGGYALSETISATFTAQTNARGTAGFTYAFGVTSDSAKLVLCPSTCPSGFSCGPSYTGGQTCSISGSGSASFNVDQNASVYLKPEVGLKLGIAGANIGPSVGVKYQLEAKIESPNLNLYAELIPDVDASIKLGPWTWTPIDLPLPTPVMYKVLSLPLVSKPTVTTGSATSVAASSATLNGTVNPNSVSAQYWFLYSTNSSLTGASKSAVLSLAAGAVALAVSIPIGGLTPGTPYYYQLQASNSAGTGGGGTLNFSPPAATPTIGSVSPNPVTGSNSAQAFTIVGAGFTASTTVTLGNASMTYPNRPISSQTATKLAINPAFGTTAAAWWVQVSNGSLTSPKFTFPVNAPVVAPTVVTSAASALTSNSATLGGTVNPNGGATQYWFLYATNQALTGASKTAVLSLGAGTSATAASAGLTGLTSGTTYYFALQSSNSAGTNTGATLNFGTLAGMPTIGSVSPNPVTGSNSAQAFTIVGAGFTGSTTVTLGNASMTYPNRPISSQTATKLAINPAFGTTAAAWWVQVSNGSLTSPKFTFPVNAPVVQLTVTAVSPNPVTGSNSSQSFTIYGAGFTSNSTVTLGNAYNTYPDRPASSRSATQLVINPTFGKTAATWWVQVTDGNQVTSRYSFQVR
jgi:hypothetical protein